MGKVKIKKSDIWIDMTPMSDVMTLLLTFFMLTSTFIKNEPVRVNTPGTVIETKVPETDVLTITVSPVMGQDGKPTGEGQVFLGMSNADDLKTILKNMHPSVAKNAELAYNFSSDAQFGVSLKDLPAYLGKSQEQRSKILLGQDPSIKPGIPLDSIDGKMSEFQQWVLAAKTDLKVMEKNEQTGQMEAKETKKIALVIKADHDTPYKTIRLVMSELQDISQSHYYLSTQLDGNKVSSMRNYINMNTGGGQ